MEHVGWISHGALDYACTRLTVPPEQDGARLDVVLAEACGSRARAQRAIAEGGVLVDEAALHLRHAHSVELQGLDVNRRQASHPECPTSWS